nr:hypothetical protein [Rubrobacter indicoceani]
MLTVFEAPAEDAVTDDPVGQPRDAPQASHELRGRSGEAATARDLAYDLAYGVDGLCRAFVPAFRSADAQNDRGLRVFCGEFPTVRARGGTRSRARLRPSRSPGGFVPVEAPGVRPVRPELRVGFIASSV